MPIAGSGPQHRTTAVVPPAPAGPTTPLSTMGTSVCPTREEMQGELLEQLQKAVDREMKLPGHFSIGLSGGSMPKILGPVLAKLRIDPDRLRLFLVDERVVEWTDPDSNYGQWVKELPAHLVPCLQGVELSEIPYRPIKSDFPYDVGRTALLYEQKVKNTIGPAILGRYPSHPRFDMIFLGMGPDGHTASIFPNAKIFRLKVRLESIAWFVGVEDSPKPPPQRITMTMSAINHAAAISFICTGEDKAGVLKSVITDRDLQYPAAHVKPVMGHLHFFLDPAAASKL